MLSGILRKNALPAKEKNHSNLEKCKVPNHEIYDWRIFYNVYCPEIELGPGINNPLRSKQVADMHQFTPKHREMEHVKLNKKIFVPGKEHLYRRLSVRECARIQTFPDDFIFDYENVAEGYKMIGNAVPVDFAQVLAEEIKKDLNL